MQGKLTAATSCGPDLADETALPEQRGEDAGELTPAGYAEHGGAMEDGGWEDAVASVSVGHEYPHRRARDEMVEDIWEEPLSRERVREERADDGRAD